MLKMLLLFTIVYSDGHTEGKRFTVLVESVEQCKSMGRQVLENESVKDAMNEKGIVQRDFFCSDAHQELGFWPIPRGIVPVPKHSPVTLI